MWYWHIDLAAGLRVTRLTHCHTDSNYILILEAPFEVLRFCWLFYEQLTLWSEKLTEPSNISGKPRKKMGMCNWVEEIRLCVRPVPRVPQWDICSLEDWRTSLRNGQEAIKLQKLGSKNINKGPKSLVRILDLDVTTFLMFPFFLSLCSKLTFRGGASDWPNLGPKPPIQLYPQTHPKGKRLAPKRKTGLVLRRRNEC